MRYAIGDLLDQQIATLNADSYFSTVSVTTGKISVLSFTQGSGATADHIDRTSGSFVTNGFIAGQTITVVTTGGDASATGLVILSVSALQIVLNTTGVLVTESAAHAGVSAVSGIYNTTTLIRVQVGDLTVRTFQDPAMQEGFIHLLPFVLIQYRGFRASRDRRDASGKTYWFECFFRYYIGSKSLREKIEASNSVLDMLAHVYDDIHAHYPKGSYNLYSGADVLSGDTITTPEFKPMTPLLVVDGSEGQILVETPQIVVEQMDFSIQLLA
jgi:hypothetical protein